MTHNEEIKFAFITALELEAFARKITSGPRESLLGSLALAAAQSVAYRNEDISDEELLVQAPDTFRRLLELLLQIKKAQENG